MRELEKNLSWLGGIIFYNVEVCYINGYCLSHEI